MGNTEASDAEIATRDSPSSTPRRGKPFHSRAAQHCDNVPCDDPRGGKTPVSRRRSVLLTNDAERQRISRPRFCRRGARNQSRPHSLSGLRAAGCWSTLMAKAPAEGHPTQANTNRRVNSAPPAARQPRGHPCVPVRRATAAPLRHGWKFPGGFGAIRYSATSINFPREVSRPQTAPGLFYTADSRLALFSWCDRYVKSLATPTGHGCNDSCVERFCNRKADRGYFNSEKSTCGGQNELLYYVETRRAGGAKKMHGEVTQKVAPERGGGWRLRRRCPIVPVEHC